MPAFEQERLENLQIAARGIQVEFSDVLQRIAVATPPASNRSRTIAGKILDLVLARQIDIEALSHERLGNSPSVRDSDRRQLSRSDWVWNS